MGNLDKLLDALAARLPPAADRKTVVAALKAAAEALPAGQKKTRARLEDEDCIEVLEGKLKAAAAGKDDEDEGSEEPEGYAAYAGVDVEDPSAVIGCCAALLTDALSGLRPAEHTATALEGFLAMASDDDARPLDAKTLQRCVALVPAVAGALGGEDPPSWRHFLGFLLAEHARLGACGDVATSAAHLSSLIAMLARPGSARSAVRVAFATAGPAPSKGTLSSLAPVVPRLLHFGFGFGAGLERPNRGDLLSLFYGLCFVSRCSALSVGDSCAVREARTTLLGALERHFDLAPLLSELRKVAATLKGPKADGLKRRLAEKKVFSKAAMATLVKEVLEVAVATSLEAATLERLAGSSGLPMPEEESRVDRKAAAAKARGELFFEDAAGAEPDSTATLAVGGLTLERLDGIEALEGEGSESEPDADPLENLSTDKKRKRMKGKRVDLHAVKKSKAKAASGDTAAEEKAPKAKRRRTKGKE